MNVINLWDQINICATFITTLLLNNPPVDWFWCQNDPGVKLAILLLYIRYCKSKVAVIFPTVDSSL